MTAGNILNDHKVKDTHKVAPHAADRPAHIPMPKAAPAQPPVAQQAPTPPTDRLVIPAWMSTALESPDVRVRPRALDRWAQQAPTGAVDPLILALEDKDEQVQAWALALIEQDWAREQAAKPPP